MPLSPPTAPREPIHTRRVTCQGYRRADGLWDIEGHLTDVKSYGFDTEQRGRLEPGDPIHEMWLRLTVDDTLTVRAVEAVTDKSPYHACGGITPRFQELVGLRIAAGWTQAVKQRLGGPRGCTHLVELLGPLATAAFQTAFPLINREREERAKAAAAAGTPLPPTKERPALLNMCHIYASDGDFAQKNWPDHYKPTPAAGED